MSAPTTWTARDACFLEAALRLTQERFADRLGVAVRTVAKWHEKPELVPTREIQQALDTVLERASQTEQQRFEGLQSPPAAASDPLPEREHDGAHERLASDPHVGSALNWLDRAAVREPGSARRAVAAALAGARVPDLLDRASRRSQVGREAVAEALAAYYGGGGGEQGFYAGRLDGLTALRTSVMARSEWLDLATSLSSDGEPFRFARRSPGLTIPDRRIFDRGSRRLAETLALGGRLVNRPLYRLTGIETSPSDFTGEVGTTTFAAYALTLDLLEGELLDAMAAQAEGGLLLPLRDALLPSMSSLLEVSTRLCAGGVLALCAIARPAGDYVLLVQERSSAVLNASHSLAVIPKGFHQPLTDPVGNAPVGQTLLREMEEELFGREDVDNTHGRSPYADPMHPTRLTAPMSWLLNNSDAWRAECTGFGLNAVSGNFEVASLIAIHDETFWSTFGGHIQANWESQSLRLYSSLDHDGLHELAADDGWNNESLFALLQGLRRLANLDPERVDSPTITWELA